MDRFAKLTNWIGGLSRRQMIGTSIALCAVLFISVNIFAARALDGWRADVTETQVWTLSEGTETLLSDLAEPLHLRLYLSDGLTEAAPHWQAMRTACGACSNPTPTRRMGRSRWK